jgi:hypothetical protein
MQSRQRHKDPRQGATPDPIGERLAVQVRNPVSACATHVPECSSLTFQEASMNDSRWTMFAWMARILAVSLFIYAVLLLIDTGRPENDGTGYLLLVVAPLVMLATRWIDPTRKSSSEHRDRTGRQEAESAPGDAPATESQDKPES